MKNLQDCLLNKNKKNSEKGTGKYAITGFCANHKKRFVC